MFRPWSGEPLFCGLAIRADAEHVELVPGDPEAGALLHAGQAGLDAADVHLDHAPALLAGQVVVVVGGTVEVVVVGGVPVETVMSTELPGLTWVPADGLEEITSPAP